MAKKKSFKYSQTPNASAGRKAVREGMVRKEFWLDPKSLQDAKEFLGLETERETVQAALDLVSFREELIAGVRALRKLKFERID